MSNQSDGANQKLRTIQDVIHAIEKKCIDGTYLFRGEPECHEKISSNLYRELVAVKTKYSSIRTIQDDIVAEARAYTDKTEYFDILTKIQHYGGKTNLIDFTTDYNVALFFACYGSPAECGRVIILKESDELKKIRHDPQIPEVRVRSQKSVFVEPPNGYIEVKYEVICISADLKLLILQYLRSELKDEISPRTIYKDIHGFIRSQNDNWMAYRDFYDGLASQNKMTEARTSQEKQKACEAAIEYYSNALDRNLQLAPVYNNRGLAYNSKREFDLAIEDFKQAIELKLTDAGAYFNRAFAYGEKGNHDLAIQDYTEVIKQQPENMFAYYNRGVTHSTKDNHDLAIRDFTEVIRRQPDYAPAYLNLGLAFYSKGDFEKAVANYDRAIVLQSDNPSAYSCRGDAYSKLGLVEKASLDYTVVIGLNPDSPWGYYKRSEAKLRLAQWDDAKSDLMDAKEKGIDVIASFRSDYQSVEYFEQKNGVKFPKDIIAMLAPPVG